MAGERALRLNISDPSPFPGRFQPAVSYVASDRITDILPLGAVTLQGTQPPQDQRGPPDKKKHSSLEISSVKFSNSYIHGDVSLSVLKSNDRKLKNDCY